MMVFGACRAFICSVYHHHLSRQRNCTSDSGMRRKRTFAAVGVLAIAAATVSCSSRRTFADRIALPEWQGFSARVNAYNDQVVQIEKGLPALPDHANPQQINSHKQALAEQVRNARRAARPGDIFGSDRDRFVQVVRSETRGPQGAPTKTTIAEDNPDRGATCPRVPLAVNGAYPDGAPLSTVPPTLLLRLPKMPETVEYRFVGKALVLHDVRANIIVDYIRNALI